MIKDRINELSTSHGAAVIGGAVMAYLTGSITWQAAVPTIVGGLIAIFWPETPKQ